MPRVIGRRTEIRRGVAGVLAILGFMTLAMLAAQPSFAQSLPPGFRIGHGVAKAIMPGQMPVSAEPRLTPAELQEMRERIEALREAARRKHETTLPQVSGAAGNPSIAPVR